MRRRGRDIDPAARGHRRRIAGAIGPRRRSREAVGERSPLRVLILSADVGEGHVAAARALGEGLSAHADVRVDTEDGLWCLGRVARYIIRDGYRAQLRRAPWAFNAVFGLWRHVAPLRRVGARILYRAGRRRLGRLIAARNPDIVVSTHPALTAVLGRMRRRRELSAILCATITDLTTNPAWCHRGTDLHVVMHPIAVPWVERHAGHGSAVAVRPLVSARFHGPRDVRGARASLGLPEAGRLVVVSGGGWGVGALAVGVDAVLTAGVEHVVVLAGHNAPAEAALRSRYGADARVRVLGFTKRMPELLRAATAIVHGTGGVTSLEAVACGCPVIAFGTRLAHVEEHNRAMQSLGLCTVARDAEALRSTVAALADPAEADSAEADAGEPVPGQPVAGNPGPAAALRMATADAARTVLDAPARVRPLSRWVMGVQRLSGAVACVAVLLWTVATDDAFSLAARPLHLRPLTHLAVPDRAVALVVSAAPSRIPGLAAALGRRGAHVTFSISAIPSTATVAALRRWHDGVVPTLAGSGAIRWVGTRDQLGDVEGISGGHDFLVPRGGLSFGQYLLARSAGDHPVAPEDVLGSRRDRGPLPSGAIVLVRAAGTGSLVRLVARAEAEGFAVQTLSTLVASSSMTAAPRRSPDHL